MAIHGVCHIEWQTTDFERAKSFYGGMFGWTFEAWGDEYMVFTSVEGGVDGGFEKTGAVEPGKSPTVYVQVADVAAHLTKAVALGGAVVVDKHEIPTVGFIGIVTDIDGNRVGLFQSSHA